MRPTFFSPGSIILSYRTILLLYQRSAPQAARCQVKSSSGATRPRGDHPDPNLLLPSSLRGLWLWPSLTEIPVAIGIMGYLVPLCEAGRDPTNLILEHVNCLIFARCCCYFGWFDMPSCAICGLAVSLLMLWCVAISTFGESFSFSQF